MNTAQTTTDTIALLRATAEHAAAWLAGGDDRHVAATVDDATLQARFAGPVPDGPLDPHTVVAELVADAEGGLLGSTGGRFFAWVIGGTHPAGLAADWLVSTWDQNAALSACSPAEAAIEETAGRWTLDLLGLPPDASFAFTSGCQLAHVTAFAAARRHLLAELNWDPELDGLGNAPQLHVVTGAHGHHSVDRAVRLLGIGTRHLHQVPTVDNRIDPAALERVLTELGDQPVVVCLSAGDINTGRFDDFATIVPRCHARPQTWVHIDGAFGLWACVLPRLATFVDGIDLADSWVTDGHKWLNTPFDCGFVATRHRRAHREAMSVRAAYLTHSATIRDQIDWNPEWSRRGRGVPVYAVIKALGRSGIADLVDRCCRVADIITTGLGQLPGVEVLAAPVTNQGLVRFLDPNGHDDDAFTDQMIAMICTEGTAFFGGTTWNGMRAMRISVCSWATTTTDAHLTIDAVRRVLAAAQA